MTTPELFPFKRYIVRFWQNEPGVGRVRRHETLGGDPPLVRDSLGGVLVYRLQKNGDVHIVSRSLVKDVLIEQEDRYGDWHKTGTWEPEEVGS